MLDDLRRNYVLNRQNGLVIRPYRKVPQAVQESDVFDNQLYSVSQCARFTLNKP